MKHIHVYKDMCCFLNLFIYFATNLQIWLLLSSISKLRVDFAIMFYFAFISVLLSTFLIFPVCLGQSWKMLTLTDIQYIWLFCASVQTFLLLFCKAPSPVAWCWYLSCQPNGYIQKPEHKHPLSSFLEFLQTWLTLELTGVETRHGNTLKHWWISGLTSWPKEWLVWKPFYFTTCYFCFINSPLNIQQPAKLIYAVFCL